VSRSPPVLSPIALPGIYAQQAARFTALEDGSDTPGAIRRRLALRTVEDIRNKQSVSQRRSSTATVGERAGPASRVNAQIRRVIERLPHDAGHSLQFFCECGCGEAVLLTIAEYDALAGKRVHRSGHPG
jgi:hypothetical protein